MRFLSLRFISAPVLAALVLSACSDGSSNTGPLAPGRASFSGGSGSGGGGTSGGTSAGGGTTTTSTVDVIKISKAEYAASAYELLVNASSSDGKAHLYLYSQSGAYLGEVQNGGGGQYGGTVFVTVTDPGTITIKSSSGGSASAATVPFQP